MVNIMDNPEARGFIHAVASELADKFSGLDGERVVNVLVRTVSDLNGRHLTKWPKAVWSEDLKLRLVPKVWFSPDIGRALQYLSQEEALALFEKGDLDLLRVRQMYTAFMGSGDAPLFSIKQVANAIDCLLKHQVENRQSLVATGYPRTAFKYSTLLTRPMVELCPVKQPSEVKEDAGVYSYAWSYEDDRPCSYEEAPLAPGLSLENAARMQSLRGKLFDARGEVLRIAARCLRTNDPEAMWRDTKAALMKYLSADEAYFLMGIYSSETGYQIAIPSSPLSALGALSAIFNFAGHCEKELTIGTMAKVHRILGKLIRKDERGCPCLEHVSYYEFVGTLDQQKVESACDVLAQLKEQEEQFWAEFEQRVNQALAVQSEKEGAALKRGEVEYVAKFSSAIQAPDQEYLTAEEVAHRSGVHTKTIYLMARKGALPSRRIGNAVRFIWSEVDEALRAEAERNVDARRNDRRQ